MSFPCALGRGHIALPLARTLYIKNEKYIFNTMAEVGDPFGDKDKYPDGWDDGWDDDQDDNTTQPFQPTTSSTPYHGGEQYEMQTMRHEQRELPCYDERTPLLSDEKTTELERRLAALRTDSITGIIDTTKIPDKMANPLSHEDKEEQIR